MNIFIFRYQIRPRMSGIRIFFQRMGTRSAAQLCTWSAIQRLGVNSAVQIIALASFHPDKRRIGMGNLIQI